MPPERFAEGVEDPGEVEPGPAGQEAGEAGRGAAAGLLMGKSEGTPAVLIRGYRHKPASEKAASIIRPASEDLFR